MVMQRSGQQCASSVVDDKVAGAERRKKFGALSNVAVRSPLIDTKGKAGVQQLDIVQPLFGRFKKKETWADWVGS